MFVPRTDDKQAKAVDILFSIPVEYLPCCDEQHSTRNSPYLRPSLTSLAWTAERVVVLTFICEGDARHIFILFVGKLADGKIGLYPEYLWLKELLVKLKNFSEESFAD